MSGWEIFLWYAAAANCLGAIAAGYEAEGYEKDKQEEKGLGILIFASIFGFLFMPILTLAHIGAFLHRRFNRATDEESK